MRNYPPPVNSSECLVQSIKPPPTHFSIKETPSRGVFSLGRKNVLNFKLNSTFSHTRNTPRTSTEGNRMIFLNLGGTNHSQPDVFKLQSISILAIRSQTHLIVVPENW